MHLFLCYTPLQLVLALRIVEKLKLSPSLVDVFYISKVDGLVAKNALHDLASYGCGIRSVYMKYKYPLYFPTLFISFFKKKYSSVYVASVDNILMQFILSRICFQQLYTFDDGTANIFPNSIYTQEVTFSFLNRVYRWLLGVHYSMSDVKGRSLLHYTIYDGYKNIVAPLDLISLVPSQYPVVAGEHSTNNGSLSEVECNVMLGTLYSFIFVPGTDVSSYLTACVNRLQSSGLLTYYIPHPRERHIKLGADWNTIDAAHIAELEIIKLLAKYKKIHLYGFMSSCQFNLASEPRIVNHVFNSVSLIPTFRSIVTSGFLPSYFDVVDLDSASK